MKHLAFIGFLAIALALAIGRQASPLQENEPTVIAELASTKPVRVSAPAPRRQAPVVIEVASNDVPFAKQLESTLLALPRRENVRNLNPDEIHHTPKLLLDAGAALGEIATRMKADPAAVAEGVIFYERCARDESVLTSVRAVCLRNLKRWNPREDLGQFPTWLQEIAEQLPPSS